MARVDIVHTGDSLTIWQARRPSTCGRHERNGLSSTEQRSCRVRPGPSSCSRRLARKHNRYSSIKRYSRCRLPSTPSFWRSWKRRWPKTGASRSCFRAELLGKSELDRALCPRANHGGARHVEFFVRARGAQHLAQATCTVELARGRFAYVRGLRAAAGRWLLCARCRLYCRDRRSWANPPKYARSNPSNSPRSPGGGCPMGRKGARRGFAQRCPGTFAASRAVDWGTGAPVPCHRRRSEAVLPAPRFRGVANQSVEFAGRVALTRRSGCVSRRQLVRSVCQSGDRRRPKLRDRQFRC